MSAQETYYYGQGKVYLAARDKSGKPKAMRWVGDVGSLSVGLTVESFNHQESYSGQKTTVRRLVTSKESQVTATWYEHSPENLAILLYSDSLLIAAGSVTGETLPATIAAGERYVLEFQNVSNVVIGDLEEGADYQVDAAYGAITFLTAQNAAPKVNYQYGASKNTGILTRTPEEVFLRYEGINLAENGAPVIVELYKLQFDPVSALNLINTDTSMSGLETTASAMLDTARPADSAIGRFGRVIQVQEVAE